MAPTGSRTSSGSLILISVLALLVLLLIISHPLFLSAINSLEYIDSGPLYSPARQISKEAGRDFRDSQYTTSVFGTRPLLEDLSPSGDKAWEETLFTRKGGVLWVESNETSSRGWGISMFHALHCLQAIRNVIKTSDLMQSSISEIASNERATGQEQSTTDKPDVDPEHIGHCIGYIAQHLMCAADSTIEPPFLVYDDLGQLLDSGVDGVDVQHQCRDTSPLWKIAVESESSAVKPWEWQLGDTVESVFGSRVR